MASSRRRGCDRLSSPAGHVVGPPRLRGLLHECDFFAFVPLAASAVVVARSARARGLTLLYGVCVLTMLGVSALYHRGRWSPAARRRMRRLDHSAIFLAIAGTYTPVFGLGVSKPAATIVLITVWVGSAIGIVSRVLLIDAPGPAVAPIYVVV